MFRSVPDLLRDRDGGSWSWWQLIVDCDAGLWIKVEDHDCGFFGQVSTPLSEGQRM